MSAVTGPVELKASGKARRRLRFNRVMEGIAIIAAALAIAVLVVLVGSVLVRALPALNLDLFIKGPTTDAFGRTGGGIAPAIVGSIMLVLAIMATPIITSICRELFVSVPNDLEEAAIGLGATRWEMVRGVVIPAVKGGVVAGIVLGLGRALGEAIAVTQVIGNGVPIRLNLFQPGTTLASQLANQYSSQISPLSVSSLIYLGLILLVITFTTNFIAQRIVHRFDRQRTR